MKWVITLRDALSLFVFGEHTKFGLFQDCLLEALEGKAELENIEVIKHEDWEHLTDYDNEIVKQWGQWVFAEKYQYKTTMKVREYKITRAFPKPLRIKVIMQIMYAAGGFRCTHDTFTKIHVEMATTGVKLERELIDFVASLESRLSKKSIMKTRRVRVSEWLNRQMDKVTTDRPPFQLGELDEEGCDYFAQTVNAFLGY
jgi:secreted PhoX family phosphatase